MVDSQTSGPESLLGTALLLSAGLHVLLGGFLLFLMPRWESSRKPNIEVVTVRLLGSLSPPAPAAPPAPVDPNLKGPDVVEAPRGDPALAQPPQPSPLLAPAEVIPLGPKAPEKPLLQKTPTAPPKVTPPQVKPDPPKPAPKPKPNPDAELNKRMEELKRKQEADRLDAEIQSRLMDLKKRQGQGFGESSELGGGATGGQRVHPEKEAYYRRVKDIVRHNWLPPPMALAAGLETLFVIKIEPNGRVSALRMDRSSGNPDYDRSVERAIRMSTLPPLPPIFEGLADTPGLRFGEEELRRPGI